MRQVSASANDFLRLAEAISQKGASAFARDDNVTNVLKESVSSNL